MASRASMPPVDQFDPNKLPSGLYGVYSSRKRFEVGTNRAAIIQKCYNRGYFSVWELVDGTWIKRGERRDISDGYCCDECGAVLRRVPSRYYGDPHTALEGGWAFKRERHKIADPLCFMRLCDFCEVANANR